MWAHDDRPRVVFSFAVVEDSIVGIELAADPEWLAELDWTALD